MPKPLGAALQQTLQGFDQAEQELVDAATGAVGAHAIARARVISELLLSKRLDDMVDRLITSNETLAASNKRYAQALAYLTGALVLVGLIHAGIVLWGPG